jgi:hypothetical protein
MYSDHVYSDVISVIAMQSRFRHWMLVTTVEQLSSSGHLLGNATVTHQKH